jgi:hypothetical protein
VGGAAGPTGAAAIAIAGPLGLLGVVQGMAERLAEVDRQSEIAVDSRFRGDRLRGKTAVVAL